MKMNNNDEKFRKCFCSKMGSILLWGITILWVIYIYYLCKELELPTQLNAVGDFLAGAFAPLAFLWLVFGFYQQGQGLKQNSKALKMQAIELKKTTRALELQVDEQRKLLKTSEEQIKINNEKNIFDQFYQKKQLQPFFHLSNIEVNCEYSNETFNSMLVKFKLSNSRILCRNIFFTYVFEDDMYENILKHRKNDTLRDCPEGIEVSFNIPQDPPFDSSNACKLRISINYVDAVDKLQFQKITFNLKQDSFGNIFFDYLVYGEQTLY